MNDNALPSVASEDPFLNTPIRLGCVHCDRHDFDHVIRIPESWHEVAPVPEWIGDNLMLAWETHLGVCPECHGLFERCDAPDPGPPPWEETEEEKSQEYQRLSNVHPIVRQIVNRDCHVSSTAKSVVQHVISKLRNGAQALRVMSPLERRQLIEDCLVQHRHNWKEYVEVMSGFTRTTGKETIDKLPTSLSGKKVVALMRKHKVKIESLAFRLGTSQKRVRQIRETGLTDVLAIRDWIQAITGEDPGPIPEKYRINKLQEEGSCCFCGYPLFTGDDAFDYLGEMFCSSSCARKSRGW